MSDTVLKVTDGLHLWEKPKPGATIVGAYLGRLILTDSRLLFLSTGSSGAARAIATGLLLGHAGRLVLGKTRTDELDLSALENVGSLDIPLGRITQHEVGGAWWSTPHLKIQYMDKGGTREVCCLAKKGGMRMAPFLELNQALELARKELDRGA